MLVQKLAFDDKSVLTALDSCLQNSLLISSYQGIEKFVQVVNIAINFEQLTDQFELTDGLLLDVHERNS